MNGSRRFAVCAIAVLSAADAGARPRERDIDASNVIAFSNWVTAVDGHAPGREDASQRGIGHLDDAAAHYRAALELFPDAQSALLGASQVALLQGDPASAMTAVQRLREIASSPGRASDPWWQYESGAGRDAQARWAAAIALLK